ncbi:MAG: sialate O-acetylesterase [Bacteroidota bacterium]
MNHRFLWTAFVLILTSFNLSAKIVLPAVFSDNMVLQQNSEVALWGWSNPSEKLKIVASWNPTDTLQVDATNGAFWSTKIKTSQAGGPYTLTFMGSSTVELKNVMLGEVWLCSGQSNMDWSSEAGVFDVEKEVAQANQPNIRMITLPHISAPYPQQFADATWTVSTPETMRRTSAIGYKFAKELQKNLHVPVGIIVSSWGGSPIESWLRKEQFEAADPAIHAAYKDNKEPWAPGTPASVYNGMIAPLVPFGIAGVIWYQGESNVSRPQSYALLMKTLVEGWRKDFGKDFAFYYVQIAPFTYGDPKAYQLREQQTQALSIPKTGMVVISDLVDNVKDIHPRMKYPVGVRLANLALAETYGKSVGAYQSPLYQSMKVEKDKIRISFTYTEKGLKSTEKPIVHFQIAGEDHQFVEAMATISGNAVVVSSKAVKKPIAVRYCFENAFVPNLFSQEGLPVAPFRTDDWGLK